jgi:hypothetical protein
MRLPRLPRSRDARKARFRNGFKTRGGRLEPALIPLEATHAVS